MTPQIETPRIPKDVILGLHQRGQYWIPGGASWSVTITRPESKAHTPEEIMRSRRPRPRVWHYSAADPWPGFMGARRRAGSVRASGGNCSGF